eukprot:PhF_6_TR25672/c0_g1_i1/m.36166
MPQDRPYSPLIAATSFSLFVTGSSLFLRRYGYSSYSHTSLPVLPDTGFRILPDWSHATFVDDVMVSVISLFTFAWMFYHPWRRIIWRRTMLLWGVTQIVASVCFVSTKLPDPREECRLVVCRILRFNMHAVVYALLPITVTSYTESTPLAVGSWFVNLTAAITCIACREYYTVDVLSSFYMTIMIYIVYMWYVRSPSAINRWKLLAWFEGDALEVDTDLGDSFASHNSFAPTVLQRMEEDVICNAQGYTKKQQYTHIALALGGTAALTGAAAATMMAINGYANEERPLEDALGDPVMELLAPLELPQRAADVMLYSLMGIVCLGAAFHRQRVAILRRNAFTYGVMLFMRCFTVPATFPPDPSPSCVTRDHAPGVTCGDLIFSGHTIVFMLCTFIVVRYVKRWWATILVSIYTTIGLTVVIGSRLHYTRDVLIALVIVIMAYNIQYTMYMDRPDRVLRYKILEWFERDYYFYVGQDAANSLNRKSEFSPIASEIAENYQTG